MSRSFHIPTKSSFTTVKWRGANTDFFLDEMKSDAEVVGNISMSQIAYIKVFRPPFFGGTGGSSGGAIAIYTRKGGDVKSIPGKGLAFKYLDGYTITKQFYSPNYEIENNSTADVRTTLYWNPYITTNHTKHKATIEFFNNDFAKKYRIILCGVNADGKITWIEKVVE